MNSKYILLIIIFIFFFSCSKDNPESPLATKSEFELASTSFDVSYGNEDDQTYDLYLPANRSTTSTRVLVLIHGGGWIQGDKSDMTEYIPMLLEKHPQYAIVNLNYQLAVPPDKAAFPHQFLDVQKALDHLKENSANHGIKAEFGLIGASAGAHLALQYDSVYDKDDDVKLVCSIVGPTNFTDPFFTTNPQFSTALSYLIDEAAYAGVKDFATAVSPALLVNSKSSPTILFYGENDPLVPVSNGNFLKQQLDAAGINNSFTVYDGGHGDWEDSSNAHLQIQLSDFINQHLPSGL